MTQEHQDKLARALELINAQDPAAALLVIQDVIKEAPNSVEPYVYQGSALALTGQADAAVAAYQKAIMNGSSNPMGYTYLAAQLESMGKFQDAMSMAEEGLRLDRHNAQAAAIVQRLKNHFSRSDASRNAVPGQPAYAPDPSAALTHHSPAPSPRPTQAPAPRASDYATPQQPVPTQKHTMYNPTPQERRAEAKDPFAIPQWVIIVYHIFAAWWIIDGVRVALAGFGMIDDLLAAGGFATAFLGISILTGILGVALAAVGVGLLLKMEWARGVANIFSFIQLGNALFGLGGAVLGSLGAGVYAVPFMIMFGVNLVVAAAQIYVIGETDTAR